MSLSRRAFLGTAAVPAGAQASDLEIVVPEDGGTPRDPARIVRQGAREFHITASVEEGKSPLTHAVSRVDVIVRNPGPPAEVTLHFELSGGGTRPNFDTSHFGGMPKRDFIYVKQPGKPWQRVDGLSLASSKADLLDGRLARALDVTETGAYVTGLVAWTATFRDGTTAPVGAACGDWTGSATTAYQGRANDPWRWSYAEYNSTCTSTAARLYCFED